MLFEFKIATRFLIHGRMQTLFIILGISIGLAVQIFLSSLIDGLQNDLINKTVGDAPHITAKPPEKNSAARVETPGTIVSNTPSDTNLQEKRISNWTGMAGQIFKRSDIKAVAAFADGSGFVTKGQKNLPVIIRGMDLNESDAIYKIKDRIKSGDALVGGNEILIGKSLAESIGAKPQSLIHLTAPDGIDDVFTVSGIFELGNESINKSWVLMDRSRAQKLLGLGGDVTSLEIQVREVFGADTVAAELSSYFPEVQFQSWQASNKQLLTALKSQSSSSGMIQFFVIMAVALGISSVLAVSVMQKSKQIGILKAMGADNSTCRGSYSIAVMY